MHEAKRIGGPPATVEERLGAMEREVAEMLRLASAHLSKCSQGKSSDG